MKTVTVGDLVKKGVLSKKIPKEGIMLTKYGKPFALITNPNQEVIKKAGLIEDAKPEQVKPIRQIDTFTQSEHPKPEMLGVCVRCGLQGPVEMYTFINEVGGTTKGTLCKARCLPKEFVNRKSEKTRPMTGPNKLTKSVSREQTHNSQKQLSDFGPANKHGSFS